MVIPVLEQGATNVSGVFPGVKEGEIWYDWYNQSATLSHPAGSNISIDAPLGHIPVYIRGGSILPIQEPALTTRDSRLNPWGLIAVSGSRGQASGSLYVDDGESLVQNATLWVDFTLQGKSLYASPRGEWNDGLPLANITVLGVGESPSNVSFNGKAVVAGSESGNGWSWNSTSKVLDVTGLGNLTVAGAWTEGWVLKWS